MTTQSNFQRFSTSRFIQDGEIKLVLTHDVPGLYENFGTDRFDELYVRYERDESVPKKTVKSPGTYSEPPQGEGRDRSYLHYEPGPL